MKYYFSTPTSQRKLLLEEGVTKYLFSFANEKIEDILKFPNSESIIIDSGAFSLWNSGKEVKLEDYIKYLNQVKSTIKGSKLTFVNLDVIPKTGAHKDEIERCAKEGYENYLILKEQFDNILPIYHYGEDIKWLHTYIKHTDYVGLSPANDTSEKVKRKFLSNCFAVTRDKIKTHGFGYSSFSGLEMFPFYSCDSISYKRAIVKLKNSKKSFLPGSKSSICHKVKYFFFSSKHLSILLRKEVNRYLKHEEYITNLWTKRGIVWKD